MSEPTVLSSDAEALVRTYYRYVDEGNPELVALFHPDATYKRPGYEIMSGRAALQSFYGGERVIDTGAHQLSQVFASDTRVAVEGTFTGTLKSGADVNLWFSDFFDIRHDRDDHLIVSRRTYFDDLRV